MNALLALVLSFGVASSNAALWPSATQPPHAGRAGPPGKTAVSPNTGPRGGGSEPAPSILITSHGDPEAASTTPETVTGTTTGTVSSVTWATGCVAGPTACTTGAGTFSCSVTQTQDCTALETVTVTASGPGGSGSDTSDLLFPAFQLVPGSTTPQDLPDSLTINSVAMTLVLACDAKDVSGTTWPCRTDGGTTTLNEAGTGTSPTNSTLTPFHALDSTERVARCSGATAKRYEASASLGIGTDDFVVEFVGGSATSNNLTILGDKNDSTTGAGLKLRQSTSQGSIIIGDGTSSATVSTVANGFPIGDPPVYSHLIAFVDRSENSTNGAVAYGAGFAGSGVNPSAVTSSVSGAGVFSICEEPDGGEEITGARVGSFRIWKCTGCMVGGAGNPTEWAPIARERAAIALGTNPTLAVGTDGPTTVSRASTAYADLIDGTTRALYNSAHSAPRVARRGAGGSAVVGYLTEPQTTNLALQSQTLGTTWTAISIGDAVAANAFAGADLSVTGDTVDGVDTLNAEHGLRQAITLTATTYTFSAWAKAGERTFVGLRNNTVANASASFDLTACAACNQLNGDCTGAVGTVNAGVSQARAVPWHVDTTGDGTADVELCRVSITYVGTVAAHDHDLLCAEADNDFVYTDTVGATADCGWWGAEVEAFPMMTSYQVTTTASVTRSADDLRFDGASHYTGSPTTMDAAFVCPPYDIAFANPILVSVGTDSNNRTLLQILPASDRPATYGRTASVDQWSINSASGDGADGSAHNLRATMVTNDIEAFYDTTTFGTDTGATLPPSASSFVFLGTSVGTAAQPACLLTNVRLWSRDVTPTEAP